MVAHLLPPQVHVFVATGCPANNVLLRSPADTCWSTPATSPRALTLALLASSRAGGRTVAQVVNTHCTGPHGRQRAIARATAAVSRCPQAKCPRSRPGTAGRCSSTTPTDRRALRSGRALRPGERYVWGDLGGTRSPPPTRHGRAVLLQRGAPRPDLGRRPVGARLRLRDAAGGRRRGAAATRATLEGLAKLDVQVVIPGTASPLPTSRRRWGAPSRFEPSRPTRCPSPGTRSSEPHVHPARPRSLPSPDACYVERIGIYASSIARFFRAGPRGACRILIANSSARRGATDGGTLLRWRRRPDKCEMPPGRE